MISEDDGRLGRWDVAEMLGTAEQIAAYLEACLEESAGDADLIIGVLGDIARAKGMTLIAQELGISRAALYSALEHTQSLDMSLVRRVLAIHQAAAELEAVPK